MGGSSKITNHPFAPILTAKPLADFQSTMHAERFVTPDPSSAFDCLISIVDLAHII